VDWGVPILFCVALAASVCYYSTYSYSTSRSIGSGCVVDSDSDSANRRSFFCAKTTVPVAVSTMTHACIRSLWYVPCRADRLIDR